MEALPAEIIQKIAFELNVLSAADVGAMKRTSKSLRHLLGEGSEESDPFSLALHRSLAGALFCLRKGWGYAAVQAWKRGESSTRNRNEAVLLAAYIGPGTDAPVGYTGIGPALDYLLAGDRRRCVPFARKGAALKYAVVGGHPGVFERLFYDARVMAKVCFPHPRWLVSAYCAALLWGRKDSAEIIRNWLRTVDSTLTRYKAFDLVRDRMEIEWCASDLKKYAPAVVGADFPPAPPENFRDLDLNHQRQFKDIVAAVHTAAAARGGREDCEWAVDAALAELGPETIPGLGPNKNKYRSNMELLIGSATTDLRNNGGMFTSHFLDQCVKCYQVSGIVPDLPLDLVPGGWETDLGRGGEVYVTRPMSKALAFWNVIRYSNRAWVGKGFAQIGDGDYLTPGTSYSPSRQTLLRQLSEIVLMEFPAKHPDDAWAVSVCEKVLLDAALRRHSKRARSPYLRTGIVYPELLCEAAGISEEELRAWKPE
jgi:hypothetical protein